MSNITHRRGRPALDRDDQMVELTFSVRRGDLPALRSALDEQRAKLADKLVIGARASFATEQAYTNAARALARVAAVVNAVTGEDPAYA